MNAVRIQRREFLVAGAATVIAIAQSFALAQDGPMYGLIGKMTAYPGKRDDLIAILVQGAANMPGCQRYVVARDAADDNAVWTTEVWSARSSHDASLSLLSGKSAISRGRPLIAGFDQSIVTTPVGGHGLHEQKSG
jgi:quinol monooxygenase YgiN